jgi:hypothetical protein
MAEVFAHGRSFDFWRSGSDWANSWLVALPDMSGNDLSGIGGSGHEKDLHNFGRLLPLLEIQTLETAGDHLSVSTVCTVGSWS